MQIIFTGFWSFIKKEEFIKKSNNEKTFKKEY